MRSAISSLKSGFFCILFILSTDALAHKPCGSFLLNLHSSTSPHIYDLKEIAVTLSTLRYPGPVIARLSLPVDKDFFAIQRFLENEELKTLVPAGFKGVQVQDQKGNLKFLAVGDARDIFNLMTEMLLRWPQIQAKGTIQLHDQEEAEFVFSRVLGKGATPFKYPFVGQIELEPNFHTEKEIETLARIPKFIPQNKLKVHWTKEALRRLKYLGTEELEIEALIQKSRAQSLQRGAEIILPLFRKIRSDDLFWDEVVSVKISEHFTPGKTQVVKILEVSAMSVREERGLYQELATLHGIKPEFIETKMLERLKFEAWPLGRRVYVDPSILIKLQAKHGISLSFLAQALKTKPSFTTLSQVSEDRIELHYRNGENELVVVLGLNQKQNTTSVVTSYFKKSPK